MKKTFLILLTVTLFLSACGKVIPQTNEIKTDTVIPAEDAAVVAPESAPTEVSVPTETKTIENTTISKSYTASEVSKHSNASSCWLILDNKVYDVTVFIPKHPGGEAILKGCGKDATKMFARHPESAKAMKEQFYIGDLKA